MIMSKTISVSQIKEAAQEAYEQFIGIFVPWLLVDAILGGISAGEGGVFPLIAAGDIEFPQVRVDAPGLEAVLQRGVQAGSLAGGDKGGAGAYLHGIDRGLRKARNFRIRGQGKGAVPVQQHRSALRHHLTAHVPVVGHQLLLRVVIGPVKDRRQNQSCLRLCQLRQRRRLLYGT